MRLRVFIPAILMVLAGPLRIFAADSPSLAQVTAMLEAGQQTVRIVCLGDSVTGVYYHTGGRRAWPDMLAIALKKAYPRAKIEMFNAGISGHTTGAGLARIDHDVIGHKPHLVAVMFGLNDIGLGNRQTYRDNLRTIVRRCRESGAAVVLCTPNSVYPNDYRPMAAVAEFSQIVRDVAQELSVPVADNFRAYEDVRRKSPTEWMLLMSEDIHPCMDGHKLFAETVAETVSGKRISLADVPPPADTLRFTLARLKAGQPVNVIAMPPYDRIIREVLIERFPGARIKVTTWPVQGQSLSAMVEWSKGIRDRKPHLVIPAVPADAADKDEEWFIRNYHWIVSWGVAYERAEWDLLPILPSVTAPLAPGEVHRAELARRIIAGSDVEYVDRRDGDARPARQVLSEWVALRSASH
jgi:acyl-CoA thioesterase I